MNKFHLETEGRLTTPAPSKQNHGWNLIHLSGILELGLESMGRGVNIIFDDNLSRRVFLEGSRGWRPVIFASCSQSPICFCLKLWILLISPVWAVFRAIILLI